MPTESNRAGFGAVFSRYGGEVVAVSPDPTLLEGEWEATNTVLIRFVLDREIF